MGGGKTLAFGKTTAGHRFLSPASITVGSFPDYQSKLRAAQVILDRSEKKELIVKEAAKALASSLKMKEDKELLEEVAGLVEWPVPLVGNIDASFMKLPPEVLTAFMRSKQKYFSVEAANRNLAPHFVVVANMIARDGGKAIVAGNERVLRARLSDAQFFYETDQKQKLDLFLPKLADMAFHAKLGTVLDKVKRLEILAATLAAYVSGADAKMAGRAAHLAKADLVTGMVGEFPELQGIMGRYYALHQGETSPVAEAIAEHYAPLGPSDRCPSAPNSVALSLADKLDTLVGFFAIGEVPTGSKDPFALRRAALGLIRLIRENKLRLPLRKIFAAAGASYGDRISWSTKIEDSLLEFFADRLKVALKEQGIRHDLITAVFALGNEDDITRLLARVEALGGLLATEDGANLLAAYRRATNILRIEEKKDGRSYTSVAKKDLFSLTEESALHHALEKAVAGVKAALPKEDYNSGMTALARLRQPVDVFFDKVTVNAPEAALRENRLHLLAGIRDTMETVADFSKIEG
jgi:glycyl-tRNA synthetase beta chain